jgi:hypothetical protein
VQADALDLEVLAVAPEAGRGLEAGVADAEGRCLYIELCGAGMYLRESGV